ncbi:MAG: TonB-dependent receptor, partial [Betaproteobacteria bacterium]|nr:TonB-dependent receptor [Betaproteobacteria bacterium]
MKRKRYTLAVMAAAVHAATAHAQVSSNNAAPVTLQEVVVTGNPLGSELFDLAAPVSVLGGQDLFLQRKSTLGETLESLPGVSTTGFGPNVG